MSRAKVPLDAWGQVRRLGCHSLETTMFELMDAEQPVADIRVMGVGGAGNSQVNCILRASLAEISAFDKR